MIQLRESKSFKFIAFFLAILILHTSCSPDNMPQPNQCPTVNFDHIDPAQAADQFERMMEYAESVDHQEDFSTFGEFHQTLFGDSEEATNFVNTFEQENARYSALGFEGYVNSTEFFSDDLKAYILNYSQELETFLYDQGPDLEAFTAYMDVQIDQVATSELCDGDQQIMRMYLLSSQGYGNWFYKNYYNAANLGGVDFRGCNFFQAIACGLLALVVGGVVFVVAGVVLLVANITVDGKEVTGSEKETFAVLAGFALGIYVGVSIYEWCCGLFEEDDDQECLEPTGSSYIATSCNQFRYRVFGPSSYGTTQWNNVNTSPSVTTTQSPVISVNVPNFGEVSDMEALIACVPNGSEVNFFTWNESLTFESGESLFPVNWNPDPPYLHIFSEDGSIGIEGDDDGLANVIYVSVNTPSTSVLEYNWHVNSPHAIVAGGGAGDNWASIEITAPTPHLMMGVTVTNTCTGQSQSLNHTTFIQ